MSEFQNRGFESVSGYPPALRAMFKTDELEKLPDGEIKDAINSFVSEYDEASYTPETYNAVDVLESPLGDVELKEHIAELGFSLGRQIDAAQGGAVLEMLEKHGVITGETVEAATDIHLRQSPMAQSLIPVVAAGLKLSEEDVVKIFDKGSAPNVDIFKPPGR